MFSNLALTEVSRLKRGETQLATPTDEEQQFLLQHIEKLDVQTGQASRFTEISAMPAEFATLVATPREDFAAKSSDLADRLHAAMAGVSRATPCLLAVISTSTDYVFANSLAILKLDMDIEGTRVRRDSSGAVRLDLMRDLLPQPGAIQKAILWPHPDGVPGVYLQDRNTGEAARYFRTAFDLGPTVLPKKAEAALVQMVRENVSIAERSEIYTHINEYDGNVKGISIRSAATGSKYLPPCPTDSTTPTYAFDRIRYREENCA